MTILILGSGSFAGQALFSAYLKRGLPIIGINRSLPKDQFEWPWVSSLDLNQKWLSYNLLDSVDSMIEQIKNINPEIIIDFMGQSMVAPSWHQPDLWYHTNVVAKSKLLDSFLNLTNFKKYIKASTPEVYGSNNKYIEESEPFNPSTPYAVSQAAIDFHIRCLGKQYGFPYVIARFANYYGVGQQLYRVIPRLFLSCYTRRKFILDGGGHSLRSFIFSDDIVKAFDSIIASNAICEEYHFSSEEEISITNLVDKICKLTKTNRNEIIEEGPERPGKDKYYRLNISKSELLLGWKSDYKLDDGLEEVNNWISSCYKELSSRSWDFHLQK